MARTGAPTANLKDSILEEIPVEVVIEVGRVRMTLRDLAALEVNDVIELDQPITRPLSVVVGGKLLARGELILADDALAFRITEIPEAAAWKE